MPLYSVFGGALQSELPFEGMSLLDGDGADWTFRVARATGGSAAREPIDEDRVGPDLAITLSRDADGGVTLAYGAYGLGHFHISADGAQIRWSPGTDPRMDLVRWVLLGRVMATALYLRGTLCLHASAVSAENGCLAFVAPKLHGKSTLAAALLAAGARLAADDVLPLDVGPPVMARPGVQSMRLYPDAHGMLQLRECRSTAEESGKTRIDVSCGERRMLGPEPLRAVYVLSPSADEPEPGHAAVRSRLEPLPAFELLARHASIAPLLSPALSRPLLSGAAAVVRAVPVYTLRLVRDLERVPEVVAQLLEWHVAEPPPPQV